MVAGGLGLAVHDDVGIMTSSNASVTKKTPLQATLCCSSQRCRRDVVTGAPIHTIQPAAPLPTGCAPLLFRRYRGIGPYFCIVPASKPWSSTPCRYERWPRRSAPIEDLRSAVEVCRRYGSTITHQCTSRLPQVPVKSLDEVEHLCWRYCFGKKRPDTADLHRLLAGCGEEYLNK